MSNPFFYDIYSDTDPSDNPVEKQYSCYFSGAGEFAPYSIEGTKLCLYEPNVSWSGGKTTCGWKKKKKSWGSWKSLKCEWKTLTVTYKDDWCCCWKSPDILVLPTVPIEMSLNTNININQLDKSYVLTTTPPTSTVTLTNSTISICDYSVTADITNPSTGVLYPAVPCMTINIKAGEDVKDPMYIPQKTFIADANGNYPTYINIIPDIAVTTYKDGYEYETHIIMDMYIDKNNTSSWIYYKVDMTLYIFDSFGTKLDTTSTQFNLDLKSMTEKV